MSRMQRKVGEMTPAGSPQRPVSVGVFHPVRRAPPARLRPLPVVDPPFRKRIFCKTCKDQGCIGCCRF